MTRASETGARALYAALAVLLPAVLLPAVLGADGAEPAAPRIFREAAAATGLEFTHFNGMTGAYYYAEMVGGGAALLDADGDGDLDVFVVQGTLLGPHPLSAALFPPRHPPPLTHRLYRNELEVAADGTRTLRFTDVTAAAGLGDAGYGMGVATGDVDNDGRTDVYVTRYGPNQLLRNRGDGTFEDVTARSGAGETRWSVSASFFDYDRDGWLDLYVANYVASTVANHVVCRDITGGLDYCGPLTYPPEHDRLLHNRGDGTFEDVSARALPGRTRGSGLGVVSGDFDGDGWLDLYVANDLMANQLWLNRRDGTFADEALLGGCGANGEGVLEASMGVIAEDLDGDGDEDLFLTHLGLQTNTFYRNDGRAFFTDDTLASGLGIPSWRWTGFGVVSLDADNDGVLDLLVVNGAVKLKKELVERDDPFPLHEPNQLFRGLGGGRFEEVPAERAGAALALSEVSRGAVRGDLDNDGDTDVVVANNNGPLRLLLNQVGSERPWIGFRAVDGDSGRDLLGTRITVHRRDGPPLSARVRTDGSYASAQDPRVLFGLGDHPRVERIRVEWPDGTAEDVSGLEPGRYHTLRHVPGSPHPRNP